MGIFWGLKKAPDLEEYLKGWIDRYYDNLPERSRDDLIERIVNNAGNKRYVENKEYVKGDHDVGQYHIANNNEKGSKVFELDDLKGFPDINSLEFNSRVMSTDSEVHKQMIAKINGLMDKFTGNNSKAAEDLKELLKSSDKIEYRVRKGWEYNGSCAFQKGENDKNNKIVICLSDCVSKPERESVLSELLAHELAHAVDFSKRPDELRYQYMDGAETAADLYAAALLFHAGVKENGFSAFMGKDYDEKKDKGVNTEMMYTPDGGYRRENFTLARKILEDAKHNDLKSKEKGNSDGYKLKKLRGCVPYQPRSVSRENLQGLRYVPNRNNDGR